MSGWAAGVSAAAHYDFHHNTLCSSPGERWTLAPADAAPRLRLYPYPTRATASSRRGRAIAAADGGRSPPPGDVLYVPPLTFHEVEVASTPTRAAAAGGGGGGEAAGAAAGEQGRTIRRTIRRTTRRTTRRRRRRGSVSLNASSTLRRTTPNVSRRARQRLPWPLAGCRCCAGRTRRRRRAAGGGAAPPRATHRVFRFPVRDAIYGAGASDAATDIIAATRATAALAAALASRWRPRPPSAATASPSSARVRTRLPPPRRGVGRRAAAADGRRIDTPARAAPRPLRALVVIRSSASPTRAGADGSAFCGARGGGGVVSMINTYAVQLYRSGASPTTVMSQELFVR